MTTARGNTAANVIVAGLENRLDTPAASHFPSYQELP
jgi:hypothetical protein